MKRTLLFLLVFFTCIVFAIAQEVEGEARESFRVPVSGVDWVLVIDNATYIFNEPGKI